MAKTPVNYIDNAELLRLMVEHRAKCNEIRGKAPVSNELGKMFMLMAENYATKGSWSGYPFVEDMIYNAVEVMVRYCHNYDPTCGTSPFSYFTMIATRSFWRTIKLEKRRFNFQKEYAEKILGREIKNSDVQEQDSLDDFATNTEWLKYDDDLWNDDEMPEEDVLESDIIEEDVLESDIIEEDVVPDESNDKGLF